MPPRSSLTSSFSITDANNEVVCPLRNQDGSSCRKRCIGEKRYRSMQEHIRRAHPEHYISKLPATEESFMLMINTPPSERPQSQHNSGAGPPGLSSSPPGGPTANIVNGSSIHQNKPYHQENGALKPNAQGVPRNPDNEYPLGSMLHAASAAATLAQLHNHKLAERDWDDGWHSDNEKGRMSRASIELPPIHMANPDVTSEPFPGMNHNRPRELLPSILSTSPPGRSSTLPPLQRPMGPARPRKQSVSKRSREAHHKKQRSRGSGSDWLRRIQNEASALDRLRPGGPIKAMSAEPSEFGKRWEDLIDAAASATEDIDEDRTPVPQSPISIHRASLPPFPHHTFQHQQTHGYQASPLQQALTPPSYAQEAPEPFPSVESNESGDVFNMDSRGLSDSSPNYSSQNPQIYCAACGGIAQLKESYACTECPEEAAVGGVVDAARCRVAALKDPVAVARLRVNLIPPAKADETAAGNVLEVVEVGSQQENGDDEDENPRDALSEGGSITKPATGRGHTCWP
ncbi:transcription factor [Grosmannia clavigera kw1407]|uniref:Transcription factor n=1 Tax=Grosmannia clavigera (strain kw1407 / UAMH 11150) TaxID=655863 RepID=F0XSD4_GROCL|nr:transcription factor [Grosmannia clavigera kw1407]EFW99444.1 transcription factor [Grosmannia clavigera kw1407]